MPTIKSPRKSSLQYWHRRRATKPIARVRSWTKSKEVKPLGFLAYKAGMTHVHLADNRKTSLTKGQEVFLAATVLECPPMKILGYRFYTKDAYGLQARGEILFEKPDKELKRKISIAKKKNEKVPEIFDDIRLIVHTQPKLIGLKKKPEILEIAIGGDDVNAKLEYAKEHLGKEINAKDIFKEGKYVDVHAVTKGKGNQGPVKRHGVSIRVHKSEKTKRGPGSLGPWTGNRSWTVAHAGQTGYHQRVEYNKRLLKIGDKPEEVNPKGGFVRYGVLKNNFLLVKGSLPGSIKRTVVLTDALRLNKKLDESVPELTHISTASKQK